MVVKTKKGYFEVLKNVKNALDIHMFEECYIEEWYDQFNYIVGDISDAKLRLKGFSGNPGSKSYYHFIPDYLLESCTYQPAYFILKKINEDYYSKHQNDRLDPSITLGEDNVVHIEKENFDKETLTLEHTQKNQPHIVIDSVKMNAVKTYPLPNDLVKEVVKEKLAETQNRRFNKDRQSRNKQARSER